MMSKKPPWNDWIPGVLNAGQLTQLVEEGYLLPRELKINPSDQSSFDLTLDNEGYRLKSGSVKPSKAGYLKTLTGSKLVDRLKPEADGSYILARRQTYLFKLNESFAAQHRAALKAAGFFGQATARSSVGRLDVLARLVFDGMTGYEGFAPAALETGNLDMLLEVTPISFNVRVKPGIALSQLRIFYGDPLEVVIKGEPLHRAAIGNSQEHDGVLSVDLSPTTIGHRKLADVIAIRSKIDIDEPVNLWPCAEGENPPDPRRFWELVTQGRDERLAIEPARFYILRSKELMHMPRGVAVYCRASDETLGEMRIHYAGFVHPLFGSRRTDGKEGTPLIFEVRGHDFPVTLEDGERMARLTFYRMSADAELPKSPPSYNDQGLKLSGFFPDWPEDALA